MKFVFETGKEITCYDEAIAKILRQDKRYKEITTDKEVEKGKGKIATKSTDKEVEKGKGKIATKSTDKEVEKDGEKDAKV